jgi:ATP-dependent DNA helicase RecG
MDELKTSIEYIKGVGPNRAKLMREELNISNYEDLLTFFPFRHIDRSKFYKISEIPRNNIEIQIIGQIIDIKIIDQRKGKRMVAILKDFSGEIDLVWFKGHKWIKESIIKYKNYVIFGKINWFKGKASIPHPEIQIEDDFKKKIGNKLHPIYHSTEKLTNSGFTQRTLKNIVFELLKTKGNKLKENLPNNLINKLKLISNSEAIKQIHFPENNLLLAKAQFRLKFEELFLLQIKMLIKNIERKEKIKGFKFNKIGKSFNSFYKKSLPFNLTSSQKKVIKEIRRDLSKGIQMNRLLQGDVGSGKTIIAVLCSLIAIDNNFQSTIVAPTEILAQQHYNSFKSLLSKTNVNCSLLTGSSTKKERNDIKNKLMDGSLNILIGTHAVLEGNVEFNNLGLAVIDEQHRFGVAQRSKLWLKNNLPPHILVMTATPIPRTLAMSIYGDLDVSIIKELPPGRIPVKTVHRYENKRLQVFKFIKDQIDNDEQGYIVYPLIEESSKLDYKDLMDGYESISRYFPKPKYQISIVHGKMSSEEKKIEMDRFINHKTQIMVATTVIEVGVDIPNASLILIESAERFGLSQLHQLRGRVGRGEKQSYCILMSSNKLSENGKIRLKTMVDTNNGFNIAEVDLKLRGPGDLLGTQQSGIIKLKISDLVKDSEIIILARNEAVNLLKQDPNLYNKENLILQRTISKMELDKNFWNLVS